VRMGSPYPAECTRKAERGGGGGEIPEEFQVVFSYIVRQDIKKKKRAGVRKENDISGDGVRLGPTSALLKKGTEEIKRENLNKKGSGSAVGSTDDKRDSALVPDGHERQRRGLLTTEVDGGEEVKPSVSKWRKGRREGQREPTKLDSKRGQERIGGNAKVRSLALPHATRRLRVETRDTSFHQLRKKSNEKKIFTGGEETGGEKATSWPNIR